VATTSRHTPRIEAHMATIDHLILNINDITSSVDFYVNVLGFELEGEDGPFTVIRISI
jgi:catechol-2,3-dioxygenase